MQVIKDVYTSAQNRLANWLLFFVCLCRQDRKGKVVARDSVRDEGRNQRVQEFAAKTGHISITQHTPHTKGNRAILKTIL